MNKLHPMQPIELDDSGIPRFKENKVIRYLMMRGKVDLNEIGSMVHGGMISIEDYTQLRQIMGASVDYFGELSNVPIELRNRADKIAAALTCPHDKGLYCDPEYATSFCNTCNTHMCAICMRPMPEDKQFSARHPKCDAKKKAELVEEPRRMERG